MTTVMEYRNDPKRKRPARDFERMDTPAFMFHGTSVRRTSFEESAELGSGSPRVSAAPRFQRSFLPDRTAPRSSVSVYFDGVGIFNAAVPRGRERVHFRHAADSSLISSSLILSSGLRALLASPLAWLILSSFSARTFRRLLIFNKRTFCLIYA